MASSKPPKPEKPSSDLREGMKNWGQGWSLVIEFLAYLAVLGYWGHWLDERYGWNGKGLFGGLMLALVAWIYRVVKQSWHLFK